MVAVKKLAVALASLAGLTVTANGYRPLSKRGYLSMYAFSFGVFATELPLQLIAGQAALLAAVTGRLTPQLRRFSWLVSALSWLGLLGLVPEDLIRALHLFQLSQAHGRGERESLEDLRQCFVTARTLLMAA